MAEITDILTTLLERTRQDKVAWQTTADESTFLVVLGKASMTIHEGLHDDSVILRILNQEGREIESMYSGSDSEQTTASEDRQLQELYTMARRIALGVDSQLDELLKELQAEA